MPNTARLIAKGSSLTDGVCYNGATRGRAAGDSAREGHMGDGGLAAMARGPVVLVRSPHAGSAGRNDPERLLADAGVRIGLSLKVSDLDHNAPRGRAWRDAGFAAAVAAGGDGTLGAVASQLVGTDLPLGILPMGTSNDTARSLNVPLDLADAARTIAHGAAVPVDGGQAVPATTEPLALSPESAGARDVAETACIAARAGQGAIFLHALTLGLNVEFARLATDIARRQQWGRLNYAASALEAVRQFRPLPLTLRFREARELGSGVEQQPDAQGNMTVQLNAVQIAVVNLPVFGGGMNLRVPGVALHDRLLDFVVIEAFDPAGIREIVEGWIGALARLAERFGAAPEAREAVDRGTAHEAQRQEAENFALPGVRRFQARSAVIESPHTLDVTLDGEIRARTPVEIRVAPEPVRVLLPTGARI
jgi:diacylglycerol kinase (ATP)